MASVKQSNVNDSESNISNTTSQIQVIQSQPVPIHIHSNGNSNTNNNNISNQNYNINPENDPELPDTPTAVVNRSSSNKDVFFSIKNTANKIARRGSRKLRNLSTKKKDNIDDDNTNNDNDTTSNNTTPQKPLSKNDSAPNSNNSTPSKTNALLTKIKLKKNKTFFNQRKQSASNPGTPRASDNDDNNNNNNNNPSKSPIPLRKSNIVIGATYSHSDNEIVDKTLQSLQKRRRELQHPKKKLFKRKRQHNRNGLFSKKHIDDNNIKDKESIGGGGGGGDIYDENEHKYNDSDVDKYNEVIDDEKQSNFTFQFLKNVDMSKMNNIISQSSGIINNFMAKQKSKVINKTTNVKAAVITNKNKKDQLKAIPQNCLELWKKSMEYETNRFAKMSSQATYKPFNNSEKEHYFDTSEAIKWENRIMTDIIRAGKLFVCGEVDEIFEFPSFKSTIEKEELVRTTIRYLESAVQDAITSLLHKGGDKKLNKDAAKEISIKAVRQSLISLCQEFVNDPYFKYLKESCEKFNLQPTDIGLIGNQDVKSIKSWTPRLCINITGNRIYTHIVRVFQCYELSGIEAFETQIYFGFKRTYSIDCLGGPPIILPPIFLSHDKLKQVAYQISIPKEKILENIYLDIPIPKAEDFIPSKE